MLIVPHAGYVYSGAVAASAYRGLVGLADSIDRVILAGPTHRVPVPGIAVPEVAAFDTPLGRVPVDTATVSRLLSLPHVYATNLPHRMEHSLEVQLPFLQVTLEQFSLVPLAVGDATAATVADVLEACWGGPETLVVVSTDLTPELIDRPCDWVVCDASFIGLAKVLERPLELAAPKCRLVALIKPQFEVGRDEVGKKGVVSDPALHRRVCDEVRAWVEAKGFVVQGIVESPITGPEGNIEFLISAWRDG